MASYKDTHLSPEERARLLLNEMTIEEKVGQTVQLPYNMMDFEKACEWIEKRNIGSFLHCISGIPEKLQTLALKTRLGIPLLFGVDCIHGHAFNKKATVFPSQLAMAQSFNRNLIKESAKASAKESRADFIHWTFSPVLCIGRDLRWGRIDETFGEDSYLIGELGRAMIEGYQGDLSENGNILACAKHYIGYGESTGGRDAYDSQLTERKIREVFLPPFEKAVEAGCATVMTSYQSIDSVPVAINKRMVREILKDELKFDGMIVTDWETPASLVKHQFVCENMNEAVKKSLSAGNDMIMTVFEYYDIAVDIFKNKELDIEILNDAVLRILKQKFSLGLFDKPFDMPEKSVFACKKHLDTNLELTRQSMTLLKNNKLLPIDTKKVKKILVTGPNADNIQAQYGDWTFFTHPNPEPNAVPETPYYTMKTGIENRAEKENIKVLYEKGCEIKGNDFSNVSKALEKAKECDLIIAVIGDDVSQNGEQKDRSNLELSGIQNDFIKSLKETGKPLVTILVNCKPLVFDKVLEYSDALLETFNSGMLGGTAAAEILFGDINPSGKLPISFPRSTGQLPVYYNNFAGWHGGKYIDVEKEPLFPFGFGLSYTSFEYSNLKTSVNEFSKDTPFIDVFVDVKNTGKISGFETVQVYINDKISSIMTPVTELKAFEKVHLEPGEKKTVKLTIPVKEFFIVLPDNSYVLEEGEFEIMAGSDSIKAKELSVTIKAI